MLFALGAGACVIPATVGEAIDAVPEEQREVDCDGTVEICDGVDNDCDGIVDPEPVCDREMEYRQGARLDLLFVLDTGPELAPYRASLREALPGMLEPLLLTNAHVGFISARQEDEGRLIEAYGLRWLEGSVPLEVRSRWLDAVFEVFDAAAPNAALDVTLEAVEPSYVPNEGFRRDGAHLTVVSLVGWTDESITPLDEALTTFGAMSSGMTWNTVGPTRAGCMDGPVPLHLDLARLTGGVVRSICAPDYGGFLDAIGQVAAYESLQRRFLLPDAAVPGSVRVEVRLPESHTTRELHPTAVNLSADAREVILVEPPPAGSWILIAYRADPSAQPLP